MRNIFIICFISILLSSCSKNLKPLPEAVTNNAVALVSDNDKIKFYSFNGLSEGKTWKDVNNKGFVYKKGQWSRLKMPQYAKPVLASTAVNIGTKIYLIGGYTVNSKGEEKSISDIFALDTITEQWSTATTMPVPVDDTVALVYANRYIYLISGWHDTDNINLVQVFDTKENIWLKSTGYPAPPVFGHAGGIVGNIILICDGVKVVTKDESRDFVSSPVCVKGVIDKLNPSKITWQIIDHYSHIAHYRMAAVGDVDNGKIVFAGGSNNPYNYNGIGYNNIASEPSNTIFVYDIETQEWKQHNDVIPASMDHRALLTDGNWFYIIGGMKPQQEVSNQIIKFKLDI